MHLVGITGGGLNGRSQQDTRGIEDGRGVGVGRVGRVGRDQTRTRGIEEYRALVQTLH